MYIIHINSGESRALNLGGSKMTRGLQKRKRGLISKLKIPQFYRHFPRSGRGRKLQEPPWIHHWHKIEIGEYIKATLQPRGIIPCEILKHSSRWQAFHIFQEISLNCEKLLKHILKWSCQNDANITPLKGQNFTREYLHGNTGRTVTHYRWVSTSSTLSEVLPGEWFSKTEMNSNCLA